VARPQRIMVAPFLFYAIAASFLTRKARIPFPTRSEIMAEKRAITRARLRKEEAHAEREKLEATRHAELLAAISAVRPQQKKEKTKSARSTRRISIKRR
jgi:hypothetical protein